MVAPETRQGQTILLVLTIGVTAAVTALVCCAVPRELQAEKASEEATQIIAFPVQLSRQSDGMAVVDVTNYSICIYQFQSQRPAHERLVLVASRSFRHDRQLEDYNTLPHPSDVADMLRRAALLGASGGEESEIDTNQETVQSGN